jgi:micrococcal nuclease
MNRLFRRAVAVGLALAAMSPAALSTTADAAVRLPSSGHCYGSSGPICQFQYGVVWFDGAHGYAGVDDGDTVDVNLFSKGTSRLSGTIKPVRFTGINAMEMHRYSSRPANWTGECYAIPAGRLVYSMVRASKYAGHSNVVRLAALSLSSHHGARLRRQVSTWNGTRWVDVDLRELQQGLALFDANGPEHAWNMRYSAASQRAALAGRGLFDRTHCGSGPDQTAQLRVLVKWDADGSDGDNVNGEWAMIRNDGATDVSLSGWWLRDSFYRGYKARGYVFPKGTVVPAGSSIKLHAGCGTNTATNYYFCPVGGGAIWDNAGGAPINAGDGGYLFDPDGDLRAWMTYSCYVRCADPLDGKIQLRASPKGASAEYVDITNTSSSTVDLFGHQLFQNPDYYDFGTGDVIPAGGTLRLFMQGSNRSQTMNGATDALFWGLPDYQLVDGGDSVVLVNYRNHRITCSAWGTRHC